MTFWWTVLAVVVGHCGAFLAACFVRANIKAVLGKDRVKRLRAWIAERENE